jgi:hypothetical protein
VRELVLHGRKRRHCSWCAHTWDVQTSAQEE